MFIHSRVKTIGDEAFFENKNLKTVIMEYGVEKIGRSAFDSCDLEHAYLPESVLFIDTNAYAENARLKVVVIPNSTMDMGDDVFFDSGVEEAILPGCHDCLFGHTMRQLMAMGVTNITVTDSITPQCPIDRVGCTRNLPIC